MTRVVIDAGPLVALLNRNDRHHAWTREVLDTVEPPVFTCEAIISEACFLLAQVRNGVDAVMELLSKEIVRVDFRMSSEVNILRALISKYSGVPMSFADACLVRMSELDEQSRILTLDSDFQIYRRNRRHAIPTIMPDRET